MQLRILFLFLLAKSFLVASLAHDLKHIVSETSALAQEIAAVELIQRAIGVEAATRFIVSVNKNLDFRSFELSKTVDGEISIKGSDGVSVAKAFHHYLKYYLNIDLTWYKSSAEIPTELELPNVTLTSKSASDFIYYQNVCTWSYSFAWWNWHDWRRHIDWMAMMGITLTIAPTQEYIWHDIYKSFGLNETEIAEHFAGPAFQAWQRMGNIRGWGGPLTATYRRRQLFLQKQILKAQRELGMSVALPAFAGHLPVAMQRVYPHVNFSTIDEWNRFPEQYCCALFLDPNEPLFREIAGKFLQRVNEIYGSNHIYFADPFNEIFPRSDERAYINMTAYHIYESMRLVDPAAIWLLQGWMFLKGNYWTDTLVETFLTAVPRGKLLVLDLHSELFPQYERTKSYYGQPFIWCMLHNFGGTLGMHGSADVVNERISKARLLPNSTMVGVGITPEGINQNYVMYSLAMERAWLADDLQLDAWLSFYADVTNGIEDANLHQAWQLLRRSVYAYYGPTSLHGKYTITRRPALNLKPWIWYNITDVHEALNLTLNVHTKIPSKNYAAYKHHLVDLTRQYLQVIAEQLYMNLIAAFNKHQLERFTYVTHQFHNLFDDLEVLLASDEHFLLGRWLESAKSMAETPLEHRLYEINARNQITAWGPHGQILDYATKQWSGIVRDYYHPRWRLFMQLLEQSLRTNKKFNNNDFKRRVSDEIENSFTTLTKTYATNATGNSFKIAKTIYDYWTAQFSNVTFLRHCPLTVKNVHL